MTAQYLNEKMNNSIDHATCTKAVGQNTPEGTARGYPTEKTSSFGFKKSLLCAILPLPLTSCAKILSIAVNMSPLTELMME